MAARSGRADPVLAVEPAGRHPDAASGAAGELRWRIEHDYREVKTGLGLDHYEGRTWPGWHHHTTLVSAAHAFLTLQRLDPKPPAPE
jgi:SRSO17 transposase